MVRVLSGSDGVVGIGSPRGCHWATRYSPNGMVQLLRQFGFNGFGFLYHEWPVVDVNGEIWGGGCSVYGGRRQLLG
ncbi:hypothetical protein RHMOL_Rhmol09G0085700 [Rhododendron molle]|uniref:Uncharacterized protein n=1 Tax=Rhododendron molle TaxID=49168 RepID=A0ACC0MB83_RHOML|nr:hypothetical protein RHMOL_Rhmol09G0085700 [Rhododendron molle]